MSVISVLYDLFDYFRDFFIQSVARAIDAIPEKVLSVNEKESFMNVGIQMVVRYRDYYRRITQI